MQRGCLPRDGSLGGSLCLHQAPKSAQPPTVSRKLRSNSSFSDGVIFPWVIDQNKKGLTLRLLTRRTTLSTSVEVECTIQFGVLSHCQEIGDNAT